jgi:hypothetical protein
MTVGSGPHEAVDPTIVRADGRQVARLATERAELSWLSLSLSNERGVFERAWRGSQRKNRERRQQAQRERASRARARGLPLRTHWRRLVSVTTIYYKRSHAQHLGA